jgi:pimeloyl-ACP methyl ester carboxylesterase
MRARWGVVAFLLVADAACGGGGVEASSTGTMAAPASTSASPEPTSTFPVLAESELLAMSESVTFEAPDRVRLEGRLFGSGEVGVVLSHMRPGDQGQWFSMAGLLADRGYRVLTYDRPGECPGGDLGCSEGRAGDPAWNDLAGAVELLRREGSDHVVVGGASLGVMESLYALSQGLDADGLIWLAGLDLYQGESIEDQVRDVSVPKLFMGGRFDNDSAPIGAAIVRAAPGPTEIVWLDTGEHGTEILRFGDPVVAEQIRQTVLDFLAGI